MLKTIVSLTATFLLGVTVAGGVAANAASHQTDVPSGSGHNGHYALANNGHTKITKIKVRNVKCLNQEDSAGVLVMVRNPSGYDPADGKAKYRCHKNY